MSTDIVPVPPTAIVPAEDKPKQADDTPSNPLPAPTGTITFGARNYNSKVGITINSDAPPKFDGIFKQMPDWLDTISSWVGSDGPQRVVYVELCVTDFTFIEAPTHWIYMHDFQTQGLDGWAGGVMQPGGGGVPELVLNGNEVASKTLVPTENVDVLSFDIKGFSHGGTLHWSVGGVTGHQDVGFGFFDFPVNGTAGTIDVAAGGSILVQVSMDTGQPWAFWYYGQQSFLN